MARANLGAAPALDLAALGVRTDQREARVGGEREHVAVVLQQHRGAAVASRRIRPRVSAVSSVPSVVSRSPTSLHTNSSSSRRTDSSSTRLGDLAVAHRGEQPVAALDRRAGHLQVQAGLAATPPRCACRTSR